MTIVQVSNLFNAIVQALDETNYYHYGWTSDTNINIKNNFTKENTRGKKYPAAHLDFPEVENVKIQPPKVDTNGRYNLIFEDSQYYQSEGGATKDRTILETHNELKKIAIAVLSNFNTVARTFFGTNALGLKSNQFAFRYDANAGQNKVVRVIVTVQLYYLDDCPDDVDILDLIGNLEPPFNSLPPTTTDYEKL